MKDESIKKTVKVVEPKTSQEVLPPKVVGKPFVKGVSANPLGRPKRADKGKPFRTALALALEIGGGKKQSRRLRNIAEHLVKSAEKGEKWAIVEIIDRIDGKATTTQLHGADSTAPLAITVKHVMPGSS
tara:strand:+ start:986 stop:1372 length:387 start_codon:yes stop_codon:yes gene_type:complete